jgi:TrmH RNA methyltransferase
LAPEAVRVAEGGAEHLAIARTTDLADTLGRLRARGMRVIAAENDGTAPLFGFVFPRPAVIVVGHEREGISTRVRAQCDTTLTIPGCGGIGSLNVAIAASLVIAEAVRNARRS